MSGTPFRVEVLADHDRSRFECGVEELDTYFRLRAGQDVRRRMAACFVLVDNRTEDVAGYYTLSAAEVARPLVPEALTKKLPHYPTIPVARVGRLAMDRRYRGQGLGASMIANAAARASRSDIAVFALLVDAKSEEAALFYEHIGFSRLTDRQLLVPIASVKSALGT